MRINSETAIKSPAQIRQAFAHVAQDDLQRGEAVEDAAKEEPQRMAAGLYAPTPCSARQFRMTVEHLRHDIGIRRMQIQRHIEFLHPRPKNVVCAIVVVRSQRVSIDQRAFEAELKYSAVQFVNRPQRRMHGQRGKTAEPCWVTRNLCCQE